MLRAPAGATLFPYTTLFRSGEDGLGEDHEAEEVIDGVGAPVVEEAEPSDLVAQVRAVVVGEELRIRREAERSEEHTSELQSPVHLVSRLLPEKQTGPPSATC